MICYCFDNKFKKFKNKITLVNPLTISLGLKRLNQNNQNCVILYKYMLK